MTLGALGLALLTLWYDRRVDRSRSGLLQELVYSGGPDGAQSVLSVIAGSMMTVAGVVFSITIVALTLASNQFGPRLLASFMSDRGNQVTLGTFIATFIYCLFVLRSIRLGDTLRVPHVSVTVALVLAVASLSVLIYFIHHIATMIQAPHLIAAIGRELLRHTDHLFPDPDDVEGGHSPTVVKELPSDFDALTRTVRAHGHGYAVAIDMDGLRRLATRDDLVVVVDVRPGTFVVAGDALARVWPDHRAEDAEEAIRRMTALGSRRTPHQDIAFPVQQLAEVAVRSLSPGLNDPYTASTCIDHLTVGLCELAGRPFPPERIVDEDGELRVVVADAVSFGDLLHAAFDQVRENAAEHTQTYLRLLQALGAIAGRARDTDRADDVMVQGERILAQARQQLRYPWEVEQVDQEHRSMADRVQSRRRLLVTGSG